MDEPEIMYYEIVPPLNEQLDCWQVLEVYEDKDFTVVARIHKGFTYSDVWKIAHVLAYPYREVRSHESCAEFVGLRTKNS